MNIVIYENIFMKWGILIIVIEKFAVTIFHEISAASCSKRELERKKIYDAEFICKYADEYVVLLKFIGLRIDIGPSEVRISSPLLVGRW